MTREEVIAGLDGGSGAWMAVHMGRKAIAAELKPSYYRQMVKNMETAESEDAADQAGLEFSEPEDEPIEVAEAEE